jgi:S1-C subfamily serine protease
MLDVEGRYGLVTGLRLHSRPPCLAIAVAEASPAPRAGLRPGDVLTRLDDKPIQDACDFALALVDRKPGETLKLQWWRKEQLVSADLTLAARRKPDGAAMLRYFYGLTAVPLKAETAQTMKLRVMRGVVITAIRPGPPYDVMPNPPMPGDVLARINGIRPRDLDQVGLLLDRVKPGDPVHFVFVRVKNHQPTGLDMVLTIQKKH